MPPDPRPDHPAEPSEPPEGLTIDEAARRLGMSAQTIRRWIRAGKVRATHEPVASGPGPGWQYRIHLDEALQVGTLRRRARTRTTPPVPTAAEHAADLAIARAIRQEFDRHEVAVLPSLAELRRSIRGQRPAEPAPDWAPERAILAEFQRHEQALRPLLAGLQDTIRQQRARIAALERAVEDLRAHLTELAQRRRPGRPRRQPPTDGPPEC